MPVVTVTTNAFLQLARSELKAFGFPELPLVLIPHPYGQVPRERAVAVAEKAAQEVLDQLERAAPRRAALA